MNYDGGKKGSGLLVFYAKSLSEKLPQRILHLASAAAAAHWPRDAHSGCILAPSHGRFDQVVPNFVLQTVRGIDFFNGNWAR